MIHFTSYLLRWCNVPSSHSSDSSIILVILDEAKRMFHNMIPYFSLDLFSSIFICKTSMLLKQHDHILVDIFCLQIQFECFSIFHCLLKRIEMFSLLRLREEKQTIFWNKIANSVQLHVACKIFTDRSLIFTCNTHSLYIRFSECLQ